MAKISENSKKVITYLQQIAGKEEVTAADVAAALGLEKRTVDGVFTTAIQRKGYGVRVPAEMELEDGTHKAIKLLRLTDEGLNYDPNKEEEA